MEMNSKLFDDLTASYKVEKQKWVHDSAKNMKQHYNAFCLCKKIYFWVKYFICKSVGQDFIGCILKSGHYMPEWSQVVGWKEFKYNWIGVVKQK